MRSRSDGRSADQIRNFNITYNVIEHAAGSVLIELGKTKVLCAVTMQQNVPPFLRGKNTGWLTAEYAMLPAATASRTPRESTAMQRNGRSVEISRFIGRVLRTVTNIDALDERTITIDCDVLQADGGTRTASITGAYLALEQAQNVWLAQGIIAQPIVRDAVVAVSIGVMAEEVLLDPDFVEDSRMDADFNIVMTQSGNVIEIQGGAEKKSISWQLFDQVRERAQQGAQQLFAACEAKKGTKKELPIRPERSEAIPPGGMKGQQESTKNSLFSLQNRMASLSS